MIQFRVLECGICLLLLLSSGTAECDGLLARSTYYVDGPGGAGVANGGNDRNPGTITAPWLTLVHATRQLKPGDTLCIRGGTYAEYPRDTIPSGVPEARVTVSNYQDEVVTVRPALGQSQDSVISIKDRCYITLRGLILDGDNRITQHTLVIWGNAAHHIQVANSTIMNGHSSGIVSSANECEFSNLKVHHNGTTGLHHGIYIGTDNNVIDGCELSYNRGFGIHIYTQASRSADNNIIRNCYAHHNGIAGGIIAVGSGNVAYNNVFAANGGTGLVVRGIGTRIFCNTLHGNPLGFSITGTKNAAIKNNLVADKNTGLGAFLAKQPAEIAKKTGRGSSKGSRGAASAATNTDLIVANNLTRVDLPFIAPDKGDFRLKDGGPADVGAVLMERDGVVRPHAPESWARRSEFQVAAFTEEAPVAKAPPPPLAPPITYVVAPNGDDANPGTEEKPWKTLKKAAASVAPGDTVRIRAGVYSASGSGGQSIWKLTRAGLKEAPITYKAYGDGEVRIHGAAVIPPTAWTHVKGAIYSMPYDPKAGPTILFHNGLPLVHDGPNHPVPSVAEMYPNSCCKDKEKATLYVWLGDGSDPKNSDMRTATRSIIGLSRCHYNIFDGLTLEYGYRGFHGEHTTRHITIRNCSIRSIASQGIIPIPENCVVENCLFQKIGATKFQHGMYGTLTGLVVRNNVFEGITGAAVHQYGGAEGMHGARIYGNVFRKPRKFWDNTPRDRYSSDLILWTRNENWVYNNVFYGEGKRPGISLTKSENRIFNNTFLGCPSAIGFGSKSKDNWVCNNIFMDCARAFIDWPAEAMPQKKLDYNIYFCSSGSPRWQCAGTGCTTFSDYQKAAGESHSHYLDPRLAGPGDARLQPGSPAIDMGIVLRVGLGAAAKDIATDVEGTLRPQGSAPDIGAYEFKAAR